MMTTSTYPTERRIRILQGSAQSEWTKSFLRDIRCRVEKGNALSPAQEAKLADLWREGGAPLRAAKALKLAIEAMENSTTGDINANSNRIHRALAAIAKEFTP